MTDEEIGFITIIGVAMFIGALPVFIAFLRGHPNRWPILVLTVVAGATLVGCLIALIWSMKAIHRSRGPVVNGGESGLNLFANDVPRRAIEPKERQLAPLQRAAVPNERVAEELERLVQLHQTGWLTAKEFASAKSALLTRLWLVAWPSFDRYGNTVQYTSGGMSNRFKMPSMASPPVLLSDAWGHECRRACGTRRSPDPHSVKGGTTAGYCRPIRAVVMEIIMQTKQTPNLRTTVSHAPVRQRAITDPSELLRWLICTLNQQG